MGIFWKRINSQGALAALIVGFSAGMLRLVLEINKSSLSGIWYAIADLNFLYFAIFSFLACTALMIAVSLFTPAPDYEKLNGLTYGTTIEKDRQASFSTWETKDLINSAVIIIILMLILVYFSPLGIGSF